jgi:hypothetical protein
LKQIKEKIEMFFQKNKSILKKDEDFVISCLLEIFNKEKEFG